MTTLKLVTLMSVALTSAIAFGSPDQTVRTDRKVARLQATNGTEISIVFDRQETLAIGDSRTTVAKNILITAAKPNNLGSPGNSIRAVLINQCNQRGYGDFRAIYLCDLRMGASRNPVPGALIPSDCRIEGNAYDVHFLAQYEGLLVSQDQRNGQRTRCTQSVAMVIDGVWLQDPISGTNDFKLQF